MEKQYRVQLFDVVFGELNLGVVIKYRFHQLGIPCDLLFIDDPHWTETQAIVQDLAGKGSLIVGESSAVLDQGGMVALTLAGKRIRIEINLEATDAAGLSLDSRLLKVAHVLDQ